MEEYKVLITTSGIGSRLGDLTKYTNKSLVRVGKKPAISYIVERYPIDIELVVTLGYYGDQVKDFLTLSYPDRKFNFVEVDKYDGIGSSLGYSMLKAKNELQCPFIFHASDTIVTEPIPNPLDNNWISYSISENYSHYRIVDINSRKIYGKGHIGLNSVYIGLAGINDYEKFWSSMESQYNLNPNDSNLSDCEAINKIINQSWSVYKFDDWLDIGNSSELKRAREKIYDKFEILDKVDESIFLFDDFVIKFFYDKKICKNRVDRCKNLSGLTPKIIGHSDNFYKYEYAKGDLLSTSIDENIFRNFLIWSEKNLWLKYDDFDEFKNICKSFYFDKTKSRLDKFFNDNNIIDNTTNINGYEIPPISDLLKSIDVNWMCSSTPVQFHGDYILDNIIHNDNDFVLLDWRQDFGGDIKNGDIYYDLAKLNHNLIFNHEIVHKGLFNVQEKDGKVKCDILRSDILTNCREILHVWIIENNLDIKKVNLLTAIIWLNMAPLHDYKIGQFLFYFGKLNLYKSLILN